MNIELECIPCFARQAAEAVAETVSEPARREPLLRQLLRDLAGADWGGSPPVLGQRIHRRLRESLGIADPYAAVKDRMNRAAAALLPAVRQRMAGELDPFVAAVRWAIGGNLLDAGAKTGIAAEELPARVESVWNAPISGDPAALRRAAEAAHSIVYLADNAGEIYFDRLLIEALPTEKITVFVRGSPVINDATLADAETAGLTEIVPVFANGSDAPGTVLTDRSAELREWMERSDLVIAKGQGNYETLSEYDRHIFFLLTVKCPVIARHIGEPVGRLVLREQGAP